MLKQFSGQRVCGEASSAETFGDLLFCALVVILLFVLALSIEVSQRVRSAARLPEIVERSPEEVVELSPDEYQELVARTKRQAARLATLDRQLKEQGRKVRSAVASLSGEQRFTGAREPASLAMAYDYRAKRYYFVRSRDIEHADRRLSGEGNFTFALRKKRELLAIADRARRSRGYTAEEATQLYKAFSRYQEVVPEKGSYRIQSARVGINYHVTLCAYIAGDENSTKSDERLVELALSLIYTQEGEPSEEMYPQCSVNVVSKPKGLVIGGVPLAPQDARELLLSISGRGALLDLTGYEGKPPAWLTEEVLTPTGYIGKTPKRPQGL